ncbi:MAG: hydantoinase/oxoprolinase family protein [Deltaproteobacteria bacterium]|nr:hydantoinase/oxoprolinase family protein [Deltaproteobacteria bacterium]
MKSRESRRYQLSIDTGGTFTDAVIADWRGALYLGKALTTPRDISLGVREAIQAAAAESGLELQALLAATDLLVYGTTAATNAIVTRKVARTAMLCTEGIEDVLLFREGGKSNAHDFTQPFPQPYVARRHTFGVRERINAEGGVERPLDEDHLVSLLRTISERGFEALAVCLLFSVVNPAHERRIGELAAAHLPGIPVTLSHRLLPILREFRRASATAINASLRPGMARHLGRMEKSLRELGYDGPLLVSTSTGGCMEVPMLLEQPVHLVKSGPAMAPVAAREYSRREGETCDLIVCDTGGTTFDVGMIRDGDLVRTRETWLGPRFSGELLCLSSVDVRSVGAGGGSIAWMDAAGLLRVGPQSAGAEPGPACYGRGGTDATVTDAALVAGYLPSEGLLGGRMALDVDAARAAVARIAAALGRDLPETAHAIINVAGETMITAIVDITVAEGLDPRDCTLVAGGGAAGLNVVAIARELGCARVLLPKTASAMSACGMQFADIVFEQAAGAFTTSSAFDRALVEKALAAVRAELAAVEDSLHSGSGQSRTDLFVEARYEGQVWQLDVPLAGWELGPAEVGALVRAFHAVHQRVFAVCDERSELEFLTWKGRLTVTLPKKEALRQPLRDARPLPRQRRQAFFDGVGLVDTGFFPGGELAAGAVIEGPAVITEATTTIVIPPGATATLSACGSYLIDTGVRA